MSVVYITEAQLQAIREAERNPGPVVLAKFKEVPNDWKTGNHYYFYGWAVTMEMLQKYIIGINRPAADDGDIVGIVGTALWYMKRNVGVKHIHWVLGKIDDGAAKKGRVRQTDLGPLLDLVVIGCTRSKRLFWRRPTPEQVQKLTDIFGEEPQWFKDLNTKADFQADDLD